MKTVSGINQHRITKTDNPTRATEAAFANAWKKILESTDHRILADIMDPNEGKILVHSCFDIPEIKDSDHAMIATFAQWLGTDHGLQLLASALADCNMAIVKTVGA